MRRILFTISALSLLALVGCGREDASISQPEAAQISTPQSPPAQVPSEAAEVAPAPAAGMRPEAAECLALLRAGEADKAVLRCRQAADLEPDDVRVQNALDRAKEAQRMGDIVSSEARRKEAEEARRAVSDAEN